ncbi:MAG: cache domain-containing protein [Planctomycetia bacterium]|jgi:PAS domain S-box-containing protein
MPDRTRVNFHCHSDLSSDGVYSPETLAAMLARDGVRYAALTDHDSVDGGERFSDALNQHGIGSITGVEITASWGDNEIHLLAYGFNSSDPELRLALHTIRKQRRIGIQTVLTSLRSTLKGRPESEQGEEVPPPPRLLPPYNCQEIIELVHRAGGLVFLAHPFSNSSDLEEITRTVRQFKKMGLDGIEVFLPEYSSEQREQLLSLAREESLLTSGGTDLHGPDKMYRVQAGIDMPTRAWKEFRNALQKAKTPSSRSKKDSLPSRIPAFRLKQLAFRFALPAALTICLFLFVCFVILIPALEDSLMERKRETVRELTATTVSLLQKYDDQVKNGKQSKEDAQKAALEDIKQLRYGPEGKDYFWVTDTQPVMMMHPYVSELDGEDLSNFKDNNGEPLFVDSVNAVKDDGEGYIRYTWQWKDDPSRLEPKLSHVRLFKPWNWIVGTGIYIDDVQREISKIVGHLVWSISLITAIVTGLLVFIVQQSLRLERQRSRAENSLRESHEKYRLLVESATEGTMLLVDGKCAFANRTMLELLGYELDEVSFLDWHDLLPYASPEDHPTTRYLTDVMEEKPATLEHVGQLRRKHGELIAVRMSCQNIKLDNRRALILSARDVSAIDPTSHSSTNQELKTLLEELQSSLLFLNEPLSHFRHSTLSCPLNTQINHAARMMTDQKYSAILVVSYSDDAVGIVTDGDLRRRVLTRSHDTKRPVSDIMSSPLYSINENALVHNALLNMQKNGVRHLALRNAMGKVIGLVRGADLLAFHRYASAVLVSEIERAKSLEEVIEIRQRLPQAVSSLVSVASKPNSVIRLIASVHDAMTIRFTRLAMDELGPPPARFAFLGMGSQGREEETLVADQDNGIIYQDVDPSRKENVQKYFLALGDKVCQWLDAAGYHYCAGGVMARYEDWCAPLSVWQDRFTKWIAASEPKDILRFDMCFDFRCVYGADELAHTLRQFVLDRLAERPETLCHFAGNTLLYKPPLGFFGKIQVQESDGHEKVFNIKDAMMSVVKFARIYALRDRILQTNTLQRLHQLLQLDILSEISHDEMVQSYEFLMNLRLRHQVKALQADRPPDNSINPKSLTHLEEVTLRESLSQIATIQKRISYDFLGGTER